MNKLNYEHQSLTLSFAPQLDLAPVRNLIVLVPGFEADLTAVTRRMWELANATGAHIKFLGLCNDATQEPSLRRSLITMTAIVNYDNVSAEAEVMVAKDWVETVKSHWQPGDMVVCFAEQRTGLLHKPLSQILQSDLNIPLYILSGLYPQEDAPSNWVIRAAAWIGFIAIIAGFFVFQARIDLLSKDWTRTVLLLLSVAFEFWAIRLWNRLFE
jgi:hypothetical protein